MFGEKGSQNRILVRSRGISVAGVLSWSLSSWPEMRGSNLQIARLNARYERRILEAECAQGEATMTMTPAEAAQTLGVNAATVRRLRARAGLSPRARGQGYTEQECAQLRAQLRYHSRARSKEQMRASPGAQFDEQSEVSYLRNRVADLESRVEALEAMLEVSFLPPKLLPRQEVSDSPASVPVPSSVSKPSPRWDGRKLSLPTKPPKS